MVPGRYTRAWASAALIFAALTTTQRACVLCAAEEFEGCSIESSRCLKDDVCNGCITGYGREEYQKCYISAVDAYNVSTSSSSDSCRDILLPIPCCQDKASEYSCMDNDVFVEYWECVMVETLDCLIGDLSCSGLGISVSASSRRAVGGGEYAMVVVACAVGLLLLV